MRRSCARCFIALVFLVLVSASQAPCADITGFVGGVKPGKVNVQGAIAAFDSSPVYGFRLGLNFLPFLSHEHTLGFSSGFLVPTAVSAFTDAKGFVYNSNLVLHAKAGSIVPFVTAGLGLIHQYGAPSLHLGTKFAVNYGGGLKFPRIIGPLGVRFDVRGYTATGFSGGKLNMLEVTGGILLSFGK
jgi:hypothetical protein